ncbi:helix-turn-helix transcriptional regulator [Novosphingobium sp. G106]|uniref:helix-turn-helix transcriptional regulator n=1 Tax=Novosphingobium sp. G106 TaxID=2849500 RepID=UPI001C2DF0E3|nr:helix-turn-helix transcriptional regulator [Novosphingobium sp. G106]MBV1688905.1 helix-turn-helix transcriptional regulator [Novosphingobium sp. G106]
MFDRLSFGALAIGHDMRVLFSNELANNLIGRSNVLSIRNGRLILRDTVQAKMVAELAAQPRRAQSLPIEERVLRIGRDGPTIGALLVPIGPRDVFDTAMPASLMIYLHDLRARPRASVALVGTLFGLAPAEARLAILLGEGLTLREAASRMGITENSVRTYCKSIFQKTGVGRQADIVRQIHQSIAIFAEDAALEH